MISIIVLKEDFLQLAETWKKLSTFFLDKIIEYTPQHGKKEGQACCSRFSKISKSGSTKATDSANWEKTFLTI